MPTPINAIPVEVRVPEVPPCDIVWGAVFEGGMWVGANEWYVNQTQKEHPHIHVRLFRLRDKPEGEKPCIDCGAAMSMASSFSRCNECREKRNRQVRLAADDVSDAAEILRPHCGAHAETLAREVLALLLPVAKHSSIGQTFDAAARREVVVDPLAGRLFAVSNVSRASAEAIMNHMGDSDADGISESVHRVEVRLYDMTPKSTKPEGGVR